MKLEQIAGALLTCLALGACAREEAPPVPAAPALPEGATVHPELEAQTAEFERRVYRVTDGVHLAVGFGLANSILVEGDECVFVVDSMGSTEAAREVREAFREITPKPIAALIYTHNHADHVFGGPGFAPGGQVDVYAHESTEFYVDRVVNVIRPIITQRANRMFGTYLPAEGPDRLVNCGIGPALESAHGGGTPGFLRPTRTFADEMQVQICGVDVQLVHAPGETNDQIFVWLPERRVLIPGDNVYKAFPNLYTIRGTLYRDVMGWVRSLDRMRALRAEHLAPSHTRPVSGEAEVAGILTAYRDAIQFVHDQTVRGMNQGLGPDELVERVVLPPHLARHPWLRELYGTVEWSVRSIFTGYLGWFDGDVATLSPAAPDERARGYLTLAGGAGPVEAAARKALEAGRFAWAAELASHLLRVDPDDAEARRVKAAAARALGRRSISPNGRNYYLTQALELEGAVDTSPTGPGDWAAEFVRSVPIANFLAAMPTNLDPAKSADVDQVMGFRFDDVDRAFTLHVRRGVAEFREGWPDDPDLAIRARSTAWIDVVSGFRALPAAIASGDVEIDGGLTSVPAVLGFLGMFR